MTGRPTSFEQVMRSHLPQARFKWVRTLESAVTTAWGVRWNEMQIARDILQNFYDANREHLDAVKVSTSERDARITAPVPFDLEHLFYLGSEKTGDDIGQYGEGFKAAATCLLRDHGVTPIGVSGSTVVHVRLASKPIGKKRLQPLVYDFYTVSPAYRGSLLLLPWCSPTLSRELERGMGHFLSEHNPLLGVQYWRSRDEQYALYESSAPDGCIFYRRLKRATIPAIPVVLVINKANKRIDRKVERDRDRNAFEDAVLDLCYDVFARESAGEGQVIQAVLCASQHLWERGHALLSALAKHRFAAVDGRTLALFGDRYFAASYPRDMAERLQYEHKESEWRAEGRQQVPSYFAKFGVVSADSHFSRLREQAIAEDQKKARFLTKAEHESMRVLDQALADLEPTLAAHLRSKRIRYSVAETDAILGALKHGRQYQSLDVFLAASVFTEEFARALAIFLHEHAHVYGYDGSRGFTDALTQLIEAVIGYRRALDAYENDWQIARKAVAKERKSGPPLREETIPERLQHLGRDSLLAILERIPGVVLKPLLSSTQESSKLGSEESGAET